MNYPSNENKNVIIIGSGIGGMSIAIILLKLGYKVIVLEKNTQPGGLIRSYVREGIDCEVGVHYLGSLGKGQVLHRMFDYLGVTENIPAVRMGEEGVIDKYIIDNTHNKSFNFNFPEGFDAYEYNLKNAFPKEKEQITEIMNMLSEAGKYLNDLDFLYSSDSNFSLLEHSTPMGDIFNELKCSPGLKTVLGVPSCWIGVPVQECPAFYHHMTVASYLFSSWRLLISGAEMAHVFAKRVAKLGGRIVQRAEVTKMLVDSKKIRGVQLKNGERQFAPLVIGAVHPKIMLKMIPEGAVRPSYRKRISQLEDTQGFICVQGVLDSKRYRELPFNLFKIESDGSGRILDMKYYQVRKTRQSQKNILTILTSGKPEIWKDWEDTKSGCRGNLYSKTKEKIAWQFIRKSEEILGAMPDLQLLDTYTPLTIRDWVNSPNGSAYGVLRSSRQILSSSLLNRTSIKGLYLAGQNVMSPGIIGTLIGSFGTAKLIIGHERFNSEISLQVK